MLNDRLPAVKDQLLNEKGWLQFVTLDGHPVSHTEQVRAACHAGIRWVQLRAKHADPGALLGMALEARRICDRYGSTLIINDHADIVLESGADGVHLGKNDLSPRKARELLGAGKIIGGTANTFDDILHGYRQGVDYIGLGPYRFTTTKKNLSPVLGKQGIQQVLQQTRRQAIHLPVIVIGGIRRADVPDILACGARGIAVSGLIARSADMFATVSELKQQLIMLC